MGPGVQSAAWTFQIEPARVIRNTPAKLSPSVRCSWTACLTAWLDNARAGFSSGPSSRRSWRTCRIP